jgi:hypothetical protein
VNAGVIGGVVAFIVAHAAKYALDWVASKTGCCAAPAPDNTLDRAEARLEDFSLHSGKSLTAGNGHQADFAPAAQVCCWLDSCTLSADPFAASLTCTSLRLNRLSCTSKALHSSFYSYFMS